MGGDWGGMDGGKGCARADVRRRLLRVRYATPPCGPPHCHTAARLAVVIVELGDDGVVSSSRHTSWFSNMLGLLRFGGKRE